MFLFLVACIWLGYVLGSQAYDREFNLTYRANHVSRVWGVTESKFVKEVRLRVLGVLLICEPLVATSPPSISQTLLVFNLPSFSTVVYLFFLSSFSGNLSFVLFPPF